MMGDMTVGSGEHRLRRAWSLVGLAVLLAGCGSAGTDPVPLGATIPTTVPATSAPEPVATSSLPVMPVPVTTPVMPTQAAPPTVGLPPQGGGATADRLAPPADGKFHSTVQPVPLDVLDRSSWAFACPVSPDELRYVTVSFRDFDGRAHTGEMLVHRSAASGMVSVFRKLFAADWPIQGMRIVTANDLNGSGDGDDNNTSVFTCRAVTGSKTAWSEHAYGLAIDLNPFQNPYLSGSTIIPGGAGAYRDRKQQRPGMNLAGSLPVRAFREIGWKWGGDYTSKKDYMHFSANGG